MTDPVPVGVLAAAYLADLKARAEQLEEAES